MLAIGLRFRPNVNGDVDDRAPHTAHQLGLRMGRRLAVQAPHGAAGVVEAVVSLCQFGNQNVGGEFVGAEGSREEAAMVAMGLDVDDRHPCNSRGRVPHCVSFQNSRASTCPVLSRYSICLRRVWPRPWKVSGSIAMFWNTRCSCAAPAATSHAAWKSPKTWWIFPKETR